MAAPYHPPLPILNAITAFIDKQNGSESAKKLLPHIAEAVSRAVAHHQTAETISELVERTHGRVKRMRETDAAAAKAASDFANYKEQREHIRRTPARLLAYDRINAAIIDAHKTKQAVKRDKYLTAEERLVCAYSNLRERGKMFAKARKDAKEAARNAKKVEREAKAQAKKDQEAAQKAERNAKKQADLDKEAELKEKRRITMSQQSLKLRDQAVVLADKAERAAELKEAIETELLRWLRNQNDASEGRNGRKRKRSVRSVESESDKENVEPADE